MLFSLVAAALLVPQITVYASAISARAEAADDTTGCNWACLDRQNWFTATHVYMKTETMTWTSKVTSTITKTEIKSKETSTITKTEIKRETVTLSSTSTLTTPPPGHRTPSHRRGPPVSAVGQNSDNHTLSAGAIVGIAVAATVVLLVLIIALFIMCRKQRQKKTKSRPLPDLEPPEPQMRDRENRTGLSSRYGSMYDAQYQAYDHYAPFMLVDSDVGRPWSLTIPQRASYQSYAAAPGFAPDEEQSSPIPPPPPPKDNVSSTVQETSKPKTPLRTAWRLATGGLKRSGAGRGRNSRTSSCASSHGGSDSDDSLPESLTEEIPEQNRGESSFSGVPRISLHLPSQDEDTSSQPCDTPQEDMRDENSLEKEDEDDSLTHPIYRNGSFNTRVAPRTPKTPQFEFGFGGTPQHHARTPSAAKEMLLYSINEPDCDQVSLECGTIDIASPYIPPENTYSRLANPLPSNSEEHLLQDVAELASVSAPAQQRQSINQSWPGNRGTMSSQETTFGSDSSVTAVAPAVAFPSGTGLSDTNTFSIVSESSVPLKTVLQSPKPAAPVSGPRPASSIYSEQAPSRATSLASAASKHGGARHSSRSPSVRSAQRGLRIQTQAGARDHPLPPLPQAAREYEEVMAWPMPLHVVGDSDTKSNAI